MDRYVSVTDLSRETGIPKRTIYCVVHWYQYNSLKSDLLRVTGGGGKYLINPETFDRVMETYSRNILSRK